MKKEAAVKMFQKVTNMPIETPDKEIIIDAQLSLVEIWKDDDDPSNILALTYQHKTQGETYVQMCAIPREYKTPAFLAQTQRLGRYIDDSFELKIESATTTSNGAKITAMGAQHGLGGTWLSITEKGVYRIKGLWS